jgi:hypothetical protein
MPAAQPSSSNSRNHVRRRHSVSGPFGTAAERCTQMTSASAGALAPVVVEIDAIGAYSPLGAERR